MKTSLQNLIDYATEKYGSSSDIANDLICEAMILKKEEKEQITEAYDNGYAHGYHHYGDLDYYEETYKK